MPGTREFLKTAITDQMLLKDGVQPESVLIHI
jgi:hypothetical protein